VYPTLAVSLQYVKIVLKLANVKQKVALFTLLTFSKLNSVITALMESLRKRGHWGDQDVDERIILRWIFRKLEGVVETGWSWLRTGKGGGHLWVR
jgi:hypothetical protein